MGTLFAPELLEIARSLRFAPPLSVLGRRAGERNSRELGHSIEFRDHRAYTPGDDLRRLDRHLWSRFHKLFLRLGDDPRERPIYFLLDESTSAWLGTPPPLDLARQAALVLASIAMRERDPIGIWTFSDQLQRELAPRSAGGSLERVLEFLADFTPNSAAVDTRFEVAVDALAHRGLRPGLLIVLSDFFDRGGVLALERAFSAWPHELALIRIERPTDRDPALSGNLRLQDCEGSGTVEVTMSDAVLAAYRRAYAEFVKGLEELALARRAGVWTLDTGRSLLDQLDVLSSGGLLVP